MNNWFHKAEDGNTIEFNSIEDFPEDCFGFIYIITNLTDGKYYIGKKYLKHKKTRKIGKKEKALQEGKGRKKSKEITYEESDWKEYWSSSKVIKEQIEKLGKENFSRKILAFGYTSKHLNYLETKFQFIFEVLENPQSLNDNISGRYFKKDLVN